MTLALDKRTFDGAGRLFRPECNLTKAMVSTYAGAEIPGAESLGLDPNGMYALLRDPAELQAAAASFENLPLMIVHRPQSANDHDHEVVCGAVSNVEWRDPYLVGDVTIWTDEGIDLVETKKQQQLSAGYAYVPDMTPGVFQGVRYSGVMRSIQGNHVTLVSEGRVGPDCIVGDSVHGMSSFKRSNPMVYQQAVQEMQRIRAAEDHVAPVVGAVVGMDSAAGVYKEALSRLGHNLTLAQIGNAAGGQKLFDMARGGRSAASAMDAATRSQAYADYNARFPNAQRLNRRG